MAKIKGRNEEKTLIHQLQREKEQYLQEKEELLFELKELEEQLEQLTQELSVSDLCEVMKATADVQAQWEELGIALGLDESVLLTISEKHSSILQRHYEMMRYWIMNDTDKASWGALVCAMRSKLLDEENLAEEIAEKYLGQDRKPLSAIYIVTQDEKSLTVDDKQDLVNAMSTFDASWKVLGLMLNMSDSFLESIDHSISKDSPQLTAFCEYWINSGLAYWSILVDTLKSPLLGEEELADEININHLKTVTRKTSDLQLSNPCTHGVLIVSEKDVEVMKEKINNRLKINKKSAQGIIFIIPAYSPDDDDPNVIKTISSTFENDLKFDVFSENVPTCASMACLVKAAAQVKYPPTYKYIAFYFVGYGGVDEHDHPFMQPQGGAEKLYIENNILSHFSTKKNRPRCLIFFDCILRGVSYEPSLDTVDSPDFTGNDALIHKQVFKLKAPTKCLVAYAATTHYNLQGEKINIGLWTKHLCENLKLKCSLSNVLDQTYDTIVKEYTQPPHSHSDLGSVYLKGMPLLRSDSVASSALTRYRGDFIISIQNDSVVLISLAAVLLTREVIDSETKNDVCSKQCQEGAGILFDNLEMKLEKNPEMLQIILDIMKNEKCLCDIVEKIKSDSGKDESILKKKPQKSDVFKLLRRKSASWEDFALELQIDDNERKKIRMEVTISIELKLERVLEIWMQSETTEVTWEKIIQVLVALKSIDLAKEVKRFLQQEKHRMKIDNAVEKHQSVQIAERPVGNQPKAKTVCGMSVLSAVLLSILVIVLIVFVVTIFIFLTLGVYFLK